MSNLITNPWDMASDLNEAIIPSFVKGKYMLLKIAPPKGKTVRDGLVIYNGLMSYTGDNNKEVVMIEVTDGLNGKEIAFPLGKRGVTATKYRGPKSWYRFKRPDGSWFQFGKQDPSTKVNLAYTVDAAISYLSASISGWEQIDEAERDMFIDQYLYERLMIAFMLDYNMLSEEHYDLLNNEEGHIELNRLVKEGIIVLPFVGMVTDLYRRYTAPKDGERYGNTVVTKFAPAEGKETLSGEYSMVNAEIADSIYQKIQERDIARFNPVDFMIEDNRGDSEIF